MAVTAIAHCDVSYGSDGGSPAIMVGKMTTRVVLFGDSLPYDVTNNAHDFVDVLSSPVKVKDLTDLIESHVETVATYFSVTPTRTLLLGFPAVL